jgi:hypothetical protein
MIQNKIKLEPNILPLTKLNSTWIKEFSVYKKKVSLHGGAEEGDQSL